MCTRCRSVMRLYSTSASSPSAFAERARRPRALPHRRTGRDRVRARDDRAAEREQRLARAAQLHRRGHAPAADEPLPQADFLGCATGRPRRSSSAAPSTARRRGSSGAPCSWRPSRRARASSRSRSSPSPDCSRQLRYARVAARKSSLSSTCVSSARRWRARRFLFEPGASARDVGVGGVGGEGSRGRRRRGARARRGGGGVAHTS